MLHCEPLANATMARSIWQRSTKKSSAINRTELVNHKNKKKDAEHSNNNIIRWKTHFGAEWPHSRLVERQSPQM